MNDVPAFIKLYAFMPFLTDNSIRCDALMCIQQSYKTYIFVLSYTICICFPRAACPHINNCLEKKNRSITSILYRLYMIQLLYTQHQINNISAMRVAVRSLGIQKIRRNQKLTIQEERSRLVQYGSSEGHIGCAPLPVNAKVCKSKYITQICTIKNAKETYKLTQLSSQTSRRIRCIRRSNHDRDLKTYYICKSVM